MFVKKQNQLWISLMDPPNPSKTSKKESFQDKNASNSPSGGLRNSNNNAGPNIVPVPIQVQQIPSGMGSNKLPQQPIGVMQPMIQPIVQPMQQTPIQGYYLQTPQGMVFVAGPPPQPGQPLSQPLPQPIVIQQQQQHQQQQQQQGPPPGMLRQGLPQPPQFQSNLPPTPNQQGFPLGQPVQNNLPPIPQGNPPPLPERHVDPFASTANDPFASTSNDPFSKNPF